ncbi:probable CoA ligase CCL6 [Rosa rugosa]|uniref:probable CoA ligase CCL6 n=1 Tax=Rosa rugosa TaxID=74645 RepID=UPI002B40F228|nr:probable CoA ligase CCL6 [Rosa rugosa]
MIGTVGAPLTTIEARLESVPELGYDALSSVPCGEIFLGGKTLFSGYHKRQDLTEEVLIDGWFRTGDIGGWQPNGAMKVTDRKMEVFKLSQGEYVAMESIESKYLQWPLITSKLQLDIFTSYLSSGRQLWVYGNGFESFLVAVVVPGRKALEDWAAEHHLTDDYKSLCQNLKARNYILDELNITGQKQQIWVSGNNFESFLAAVVTLVDRTDSGENHYDTESDLSELSNERAVMIMKDDDDDDLESGKPIAFTLENNLKVIS